MEGRSREPGSGGEEGVERAGKREGWRRGSGLWYAEGRDDAAEGGHANPSDGRRLERKVGHGLIGGVMMRAVFEGDPRAEAHVFHGNHIGMRN